MLKINGHKRPSNQQILRNLERKYNAMKADQKQSAEGQDLLMRIERYKGLVS